MNITNDIVAAYVNGFYRNENSGLADLRDFAEKSRVPVILRDTENLLRMILTVKKPERMLEIGAAVGYSSSFFTDCCGCRVTTIESDRDMYDAACRNIESLGFSGSIDVLFGDARDVLVDMAAAFEEEASEPFDAVFIDAAKSHYQEFWDLLLPMCRDEALIICDNTLMKGMTASDEFDISRRYRTSIRRMRDFIEYIHDAVYVDTSMFAVGDGVSVSVFDRDAYFKSIGTEMC